MEAKRKSRIVLNKDLAREIYMHKELICSEKSYSSAFQGQGAVLRGKSTVFSSLYGVSAKTIRDIWNHKTWANATLKISDQHREIPMSCGHASFCTTSLSADVERSKESLPLSDWDEFPKAIANKSSDILEDPFHNDWPFWNSVRDDDILPCSRKF